MALFRIERVTALPDPIVASTMYVVKGAEEGLADIYFSNADGTELRHTLNKGDVEGLVAAAIGQLQNILVVADIAARDALTLDRSALVLVLDATGDQTVQTGSAMYLWDHVRSQWTKVTEYESLDFDLSWTNVKNRPTSPVEDIDDAVAKRHEHTNKAQLDEIGEDEDGMMTYKGKPVGNVVMSPSEW